MSQRKISEEIRKYLNRLTFETLYINNNRDSSSNYIDGITRVEKIEQISHKIGIYWYLDYNKRALAKW